MESYSLSTQEAPFRKSTTKIQKPEKAVSKPHENEPSSLERFLQVWEKLRSRSLEAEKNKEFPRVALLVDEDKIENQQISITQCPDKVIVSFKLTPEYFGLAEEKAECSHAKSARLKIPQFDGSSFNAGGCWEYSDGETQIRIFRRTLANKLWISTVNGYISESTRGMVQLEIPYPKNTNPDPSAVFQAVNKALENMGIKHGLEKPPPGAERLYRERRVDWLYNESLPEQEVKQRAKELQREEVFPGYHTFVDKGRFREFQKITPYAITHTLSGCGIEGSYLTRASLKNQCDRMIRIFQSEGLMSTMERSQRGKFSHGASSMNDIAVGGADNVFTRILTLDGADKAVNHLTGDFDFVFAPDLLDRTDWYAYHNDLYGTTHPQFFDSRQAPPRFLEQEKRAQESTNEAMFRTGIPKEKIIAVSCRNERGRQELIKRFKEAGMSQINGVSVEDFVILFKKPSDLVRFSSAHS